MPRGGYQKPSKPAPVSAPGRLSRRTDGGPAQMTQDMTGLPYGENADYNEIQSSAPLRATPGASDMPQANRGSSGAARKPPTPLFSKTERPNEPITAGLPFGPGDGPMRTTRGFKQSDSLMMLADSLGDERMYKLAQMLQIRGM